MRLHENNTLFKQAVRFTAQELGILDIYVEKDYWITYALKIIFSNDDVASYTIFKGGTALSKCYGIIERFSEDIDLVVVKTEQDTGNQLKSKIKRISEILTPTLPEIQIAGLTQKMGMNRKTAHTYLKEFDGDYGQVRDSIIVEATSLGYFEPNENKQVNTLIGNMMLKTGQQSLIDEYALEPFSISVLKPTRTLCEKIMSLTRFSYTENPIADLQSKVRHIYDIHQLLKDPDLFEFFNSPQFASMLLRVAKDDMVSYKNNNKWLEHHPANALIFRELHTTWEKIEPTYQSDFQRLVYGDFPPGSEMLRALEMINERLQDIKWDSGVIRQ